MGITLKATCFTANHLQEKKKQKKLNANITGFVGSSAFTPLPTIFSKAPHPCSMSVYCLKTKIEINHHKTFNSRLDFNLLYAVQSRQNFY